MFKTVNSAGLKTVPEHTYILRWEDDGGAVVETDNSLPQAAETNAPRSMDATEKYSLFEKKPCSKENINE